MLAVLQTATVARIPHPESTFRRVQFAVGRSSIASDQGLGSELVLAGLEDRINGIDHSDNSDDDDLEIPATGSLASSEVFFDTRATDREREEGHWPSSTRNVPEGGHVASESSAYHDYYASRN